MTDDQYPPIPKGFHHWEPRPQQWTTDHPVKYAFRNHFLPSRRWIIAPDLAIPLAQPNCDYIEAVKEAPEQLHAPGAPTEWQPEQEPTTAPEAPTPKEMKLLAFLHTARRNSAGMNLQAYDAIQDAINLLIE